MSDQIALNYVVCIYFASPGASHLLQTNYDSKNCPATSSCEKIPVYRLPSNEEKNKWIQAVIRYICCLRRF